MVQFSKQCTRDKACKALEASESGFSCSIHCNSEMTAGLLNRIRWMEAEFPWQEGDVACFKTSPAFVDSLWELFGPLVAGEHSELDCLRRCHTHQEAISALVLVLAKLCLTSGSSLFGAPSDFTLAFPFSLAWLLTI